MLRPAAWCVAVVGLCVAVRLNALDEPLFGLGGALAVWLCNQDAHARRDPLLVWCPILALRPVLIDIMQNGDEWRGG